MGTLPSSTEPVSFRRRRWWLGAAAVCGVAALWGAGFQPSSFADADGLERAAALASGFASPDLSSEFLARIGKLALESLFIGVLGTALAVLFALVFAFLATRPFDLADGPRPSTALRAATDLARWLARAAMSVARSVPEIVWAFLFVRIFGLGPGAAVFAIALTFGGIIGKLYAELAESVDPGPPRALAAAGASRIAVFVYGVVPQVRRRWLAYALFRLECAIRSASVLGLVGAGGLGSEIALSVRYLQTDKLATAVGAVLLFIAMLEIASWQLRRVNWRVAASLFGLGSIVSVLSLEVPWSALLSTDAIRQSLVFFSGFTSPTGGAFLTTALWLALETVLIAAAATVAAAAFAIVMAPVAASSWWRPALDDPPGRRGLGDALLIALAIIFRVALQIMRAVPDLVWALAFVLWVGPGATAGIAALAVHTAGVLGRLYSDVLEESEPAPARALEAAGASRFARTLFGLFPQAASRLLAFTLFRFEVNVRAAAMIGFVGAGGLGDALHTAISLFHGSDLATLVLVLIAVVVVLDSGGDWLRKRLLR